MVRFTASLGAEKMRQLTLAKPALAAMLFIFCTADLPQAPPGLPVEAGGTSPDWTAEVRARIRDASHQFLADAGQIRAEVPERGLTGRFDDSGAHIASAVDAVPITIRATALGRDGARTAIVATAPELGDCQDRKADPEGKCIPRLEYASAGLTEWWEAGTGGFEQGWVLTERPKGDGPVRIDIQVGNADATVEGGVVNLRGDDGTLLAVRGLKAWDARGDDVAARFERGDDGFGVVVDDEGAVYPVEVDPVYTSTDWDVYGTSDYSELGTSVANAGDVNGDGYDDVIVGAPGLGQALVYLGSVSGLATAASTVLVGGAFHEFGSAVAGAGDTNGDGYDDVIVGAPSSGSTSEGQGAAYTFAGSAAGVVTTPATTIVGSHSYSFGRIVAGVGDFNGDGYDDVAVGASFYYPGIWFGSPSGTSDSEAGWWSVPEEVSSIAAAGDVNGDGYDDVIMGCENCSSNRGQAYVFDGPTFETASVTLYGEDFSDLFGHSVAGLGDADGDGYGDVVVGAYGHGSNSGRVYVYHGSSTGLSPTARSVVDGGPADELGYSVTGADHGLNDGYDDLVVGSPREGALGALSAYPGSASGITGTATTTIRSDGQVGETIATGDFNGDGLADIVSGSAGYDGGTGRLSAWYGCTDRDNDGFCVADDCDDADPSVSVLHADADGDGYGDAAAPINGCVATSGQVWNDADCDDSSASVNPGSAEVCDDANTDEDCDGLADDHDGSATGQAAPYADEDSDGYGGAPGVFCDGAETSTDCDDTDRTVHPGAEEDCNYIDDDCDGKVDDGVDPTTWYADDDNDGFTDPEDQVIACSRPGGYRRQSDTPDCDDADPDIGGGSSSWYPDLDGDGYFAADPIETSPSCEPPDGYSAHTHPADCNDTNPDIYPGAPDPPGDLIDQNCNGRDTPGHGCGCSTTPTPPPRLFIGVVSLAVIASRRRRAEAPGGQPAKAPPLT